MPDVCLKHAKGGKVSSQVQNLAPLGDIDKITHLFSVSIFGTESAWSRSAITA
jgi:hypothetical protein